MKKIIKKTFILALLYMIVVFIGHVMFPETLKISTGISVWFGTLLADSFIQFDRYKKDKRKRLAL